MSSLNVQGQCMQDKKTDKVGSDKCELKKIHVMYTSLNQDISNDVMNYLRPRDGPC